MSTSPQFGDSTLLLDDGRQLAYAEYGDPDGFPVFYFHGHPGSRLDYHMLDPNNEADELGVRVIAVDRPGYGRSTDKSDRTLMDWPGDVSQLARELGITRSAVVGYSGGVPFAAACAVALPDLVESCALVSGYGPSSMPKAKSAPSWLAIAAPDPLRRVMLGTVSTMLSKAPKQMLAIGELTFPPSDRSALEDDRVRDGLLNTWSESFRQGHQGILDDARIYASPWGFELDDIAVPTQVWHGAADSSVPSRIGQQLARHIPESTGFFPQDKGHLSVWDERATLLSALKS